jgi:hypothetical protein
MPIQFGFGLLVDVQGVQFRFATKAQGQEGWRVQGMQLQEGASELYSLEVDLSAEAPGPDAAAMLGESASLEITRNQDTRVVHGIVASVSDGEWSRANVGVRLHIVPALEALQGHRHDKRLSLDVSTCRNTTSRQTPVRPRLRRATVSAGVSEPTATTTTPTSIRIPTSRIRR